ncbi:MAG: hypothetical protein A3B70_03640 [Deltaproteobacteria bacterium RIFCSPHIGHO2_02_FULL_40_11]|nr:MAG: hypothetical protein A3B70_03640 [Deltaproteobacteria bacterium RIFCSPHIGHO2_02_FULL_40_11]
MPSYDIIIIGGGLIGSSVAYHLSKTGSKNIALLDIDLEGKYSSSELNAGGIRTLWWHDVNVELSKATISFLETDPQNFGFRQKGYLWLHDAKSWKTYQDHQGIFQKHQISIEELAVEDLKNRAPFLDKTDDLVGATYSAKDGIFNPNLLKQYFRSEAKKQGVSLIDGARVVDIGKKEKGLEIIYENLCVEQKKPNLEDVFGILAKAQEPHFQEKIKIKTDVLVNAAGAWAKNISRLYGHKIDCYPVRRQVSIFDCQGLDLSGQGMIVDSSGVYFHAEAKHILAGYATPNEPSGYNFKYDGDLFFEKEIWPRLYQRMTRAEALKHLTGWAGLYSVTPDRSGVMGCVDPKYKIYEAHSFTGRGAMQSYGVGLALSELITFRKYQSIDASALHPKRFHSAHGKLLYEGMHI